MMLTVVLLAAGEDETVTAWWLMMICFLPALIGVHRSSFLSIKIVVWTAFAAQAATMPHFYLVPERYTFQWHRPFGFTGLESFQVFYKLGFFLFVFALIAKVLENVINQWSRRSFAFPLDARQLVGQSQCAPGWKQVGRKTSFINIGFICLVMLLVLPLNNWMFEMGVGLTGVKPPELPFRLSGLLTYFAKFFVPVLLAVLYIHTRRKSFFLVSILGVYSVLIGVATASRSAALIVVMAPLIFAWIDRRLMLFFVAFVFAVISFSATTNSRELIFFVDSAFVSGGDVSLGLIGTALNALAAVELSNVLNSIPSFFGRIAGFREQFLASQVNPDALGGGWAIWIKSIHWSLIDLGHDAMHLEVLGYTVPEGFYMGLSSGYSYVLATMNVDNSWFYLILFSLYMTLFVMILEVSIIRGFVRYAINPVLIYPAVFVMTLGFVISIGNPVVNAIWVVFLLIAVFRKIGAIDVAIKMFSALVGRGYLSKQ